MMPWSPTSRFWQKSKSDSVDNFTSPLARWLYVVIFGFILILYTGLSLYQIELPGLHYDEAFEAVPALQILLGQPVVAFRGSALSLSGQNFPLMTQDYIGAINTYLVLPFIVILGPTPLALRLMSISEGLITLILIYLLATRFTASPGAGLSAMLLLAVDPTFVFWNRQGVFVTALTAAIGLAATYCWLRRFQGGAWGWSLGGAFLFGLGLYAKFLFLWLIFALVGAALLLNLPALLLTSRKFQNYFTGTIPRTRDDFRWKRVSNFREVRVLLEAGGCIAAFALGCWPLILYNLQTGGTLLSISQNASTSYYGVNNLAFGANLGERLSQFLTLLDGGHLWYLGDIIHNLVPVVGFFLMLILIIFIATRIKSAPQTTLTESPPKIALFPFLVIALTIAASIGTVSALWITHFATATLSTAASSCSLAEEGDWRKEVYGWLWV
jgi:4-amino-4-deoxy-L-arabinose transferase-like glycosyltransferase